MFVRFALIMSMVLLASPKAHALSCTMPVLNQQAIEGVSLIFEGKVLSEDGKEVGPAFPGTKTSDLSKFTFSIEKLWKGDVQGAKVQIIRDVYWGDGFTVGSEYLVVATGNDGKFYANLCGNTTPLSMAGDKLEILKIQFKQGATSE